VIWALVRVRTRAENEQAEAALLYRRRDPDWQERLQAKYHVSRTALGILMDGGDKACLCGRGVIAGDGACVFCATDEADMGRQYTEEELAAIRRRSWTEE